MSTLQTTILKHPDSASNNIQFDSSGRVGIGESAMDGLLVIKGDTNGSTNPSIRLKDGSDTREAWISNTSGDLVMAVGGEDSTAHGQIKIFESGVIDFAQPLGTRLRIDSEGKLLVGATSFLNANSYAQGMFSGTQGGLLINSTATTATSYARLMFVPNGNIVGNEGLIRYNTNDFHMAFWTQGNERMRIDSSGKVGIGVTPIRSLDVNSGASSTYLRLTNDTTGTANGDGFEIFVRNTDLEAGLIQRENAALFFRTNDTERMRITSSGAMQMGDPAQAGNGGSSIFTSDPGTAHQRGRQIMYAKSGTGAVQEIFQIFNGSTGKLLMRADGNLYNALGAIGQLSDLKLKENIVSANSQWDDIKGIQIRNFNFKEETGYDTHTQIGVVAQEVETVSPGLVSDQPDKDEDGNELGTVTKLVNSSVLYMKAVKALQEAMARIEELEAKVAALEAG
jgi:hypothetical protein